MYPTNMQYIVHLSGMCVHNYGKDRDAVLLTSSFLTFDRIGSPIYIYRTSYLHIGPPIYIIASPIYI